MYCMCITIYALPNEVTINNTNQFLSIDCIHVVWILFTVHYYKTGRLQVDAAQLYWWPANTNRFHGLYTALKD